jgi:hypothetical protein
MFCCTLWLEFRNFESKDEIMIYVFKNTNFKWIVICHSGLAIICSTKYELRKVQKQTKRVEAKNI